MEALDNSCVICSEDYTTQRRKPVSCPRCEFKVCLECFKTYALSEQDPMCMNPECKTIFLDSFLRDTTSKYWLNNIYKPHRATILLNRQKAHISMTMPYLEKELEDRKLKKELDELTKEKKRIEQRIRTIKQQIEINKNGEFRKEKSTFIKKCAKPDCNGYLNQAYNCLSCQSSTCAKCFQLKEDGHQCLEENLKTAELIRSDTKTCPKCHTFIHKIEGCDQMYCPAPCSTPFSWRTGKIVTGVIHNPLYFQELRNGNYIPRQFGDIPCGGTPNPSSLSHKLRKILQLTNHPKIDIPEKIRLNNIYSYLYNLIAFTRHIRHVEILENPELNSFNHHINYRIKYILNEIDSQKFKSILVNQEKKILISNETNSVLETFATLLEEITRKVMDDSITTETHILDICQETNTIIKYTNQCFDTIGKRYGIKPIEINQYDYQELKMIPINNAFIIR